MSINNRAIDGDACSDNPLDFIYFFGKPDFIERFAKETKKNFAFPLWMVTFEFK
jgi:hypothetical protein